MLPTSAGILNWLFLDQPTSLSDRYGSNNLEELRREISTLGDASDSEKTAIPLKKIPLKKIQTSGCVESEQ